MQRPVGVDLFSGAGGLSLGFEQAGFDVVAAVEIDPVHASAHKFNFPNCAVLASSVSDVDGRQIRQRAGIGDRDVDVVFGGAPCQGFSLIGHRAFDDPRNRLVREFVRIVRELDAKYFVFENVKGLTVGRHRTFLEELIAEFEQIGYSVRQPWKVLNARSYGVPQHRERLILMGARRGLPLPEYPLPTTRAAGNNDDRDELPAGPTCSDALGDLPEVEAYAELMNTDSVVSTTWGEPGPYARAMRCLENDAWHFGHPRIWSPEILTASMRTEHSEISKRRFVGTAPGTVEPISRFYRLHPEGISNTLRAGTDAARGAFTSPRPIHYSLPRCITVREMARLHGFPDWFRFHETKWHGARQIGNAVPPPMARAVASRIISALGIRPERIANAVPLGDAALLRMDMAAASKFWDVDVPIGKRDKKSGAKKRRQEDIEMFRLFGIANG